MGNKNIEDIKNGEFVLTREGYRKVIQVMNREYDGKIIEIKTSRSSFFCTENHPIYANGKWERADKLHVNDNILYSRFYKFGKIGAFIDRLLLKAQNLESTLRKIAIFSRIPIFISMPITAINFYTQGEFRQKEINRITSDSSFLLKFKRSFLQSFSKFSFKPTLSGIFSIARNTTVASISSRSWSPSKWNLAGTAFNKNRWSSTRFRTITTKFFTFLCKTLIASWAVAKNYMFSFTCNCAEIITIGIGTKNTEYLLAANTDFINPLTEISAFHGTNQHSIQSNIGRRSVIFSAADTTRKCLTSSRHTTQVYNIEVENQHEYFAEGILVHNCEMCISLDGRTFEPRDPFTKLDQVHNNCRGIWVAAMKDDSLLPDVKGIPNSIRNKFVTNEGVPKINAFKQLPAPKVTKDSRAYERKDQLPQFE